MGPLSHLLKTLNPVPDHINMAEGIWFYHDVCGKACGSQSFPFKVYCSIISVLYRWMDEKSQVSSFFPQNFSFNFLPTHSSS